MWRMYACAWVCVYLVHFRSNATGKLNVMEYLVMLFFPEIQHIPYTLFDIAKKIV